MAFSAYFTEASAQKYLFYFGCLFYVVCTSIVVVVEPFLSLPCRHSENHTTELEFENILFRYDPCDDIRHPALLFFTRTECERGRHLLMAVFLGSLIGYERRSGDRPAGIRTMSLVSLGSALFTINSTFAFLAGPMAWDASRVSAAIPSGVGFLGAGLIVKSSDVDPVTGERHHLIQGITTAAATWVSAAVGLACGGGLYFTAIFATCLNLVLLRFGPRATGYDSESGMTGYGSGDMNNITGELVGLLGTSRDVEADAKGGANYPSYQGKEQENSTLSSRQLSMGSTRSRQSIRRNKPSLLAV